jgi:dolichol-phosphate mannosyltransferase
MSEKCLVVVPTYNEIENVRELIPRILSTPGAVDVLVVDDNSPDGTAAAVQVLAEQDKRVHLITRAGKLGLGSAYIAGFRWALERDYTVIFEMDADFSHDPSAIPEFLVAIRDVDLVLGSRYLFGVTVVNWPLKRLVLSYTANTFSRLMTGLPLHDATGGYKAFRRETLSAIDLSRIRSDGYSFQIEMSFLAWRKGFRLREIPIVFADRHVGLSKMNRRIILEAMFILWRLFFLRLFTRRRMHPTAATSGPGRTEGQDSGPRA